MQDGMGFYIGRESRMVKNLENIRSLILVSAIAWPICGRCDEHLLQQLSASQIENNCNLGLYSIDGEAVSLGRSDHYLDLRWVCDGRPVRDIDRYEIEGGSPDVVTILYRKKRNIIVLVRWMSNSQAADVQGDYYKIYAYRYTPDDPMKPFSRELRIMNKLGEGWDGAMNGEVVHFPYKDAGSIRKALNRLGY